MPGFERPRKSSSNKDVSSNMMYPVVKLSSTEITNALNTSQNFCLFHEVVNDMQELMQRFVK